MHLFVQRFIVVFLLLAIAGCNAPRGAGIQSEVLAASNRGTIEEDGGPIYDFAVFSVNRETLPMLAGWPTIGQKSYPWIKARNQPASLLLAPGDTLQVSVWEVDENSLLSGPAARVAQLQEIKVGSDGRIFVPFVGKLRVQGMSPDRARQRIEEELVKTVPSAQVQVSVAPGRSNTADLVSGVNAPGAFPLPDRNFTLMNLISAGGGVSPTLTNPQIRLVRAGDIYGIGVSRLFDNPSLDTKIRGGDRVIIKGEERYFLSLGATGSESLHVFPKEHVSALDALSIVGGVSDNRANPKGILILREYDDQHVRAGGPPRDRVVFALDLTAADGLFSAGKFAVQSGDLVYATESPLNTALTLFGALRSAASLSTLSN